MKLQSIIIQKSNHNDIVILIGVDEVLKNIKSFDGHNIRKIEETPNYIIFKILPKCRFLKDSFISKKYSVEGKDYYYIYGKSK
tara:strand:+ start:135 stop:383 length:249 start_codon:yes stop_codon:yes gene_type:complete